MMDEYHRFHDLSIYFELHEEAEVRMENLNLGHIQVAGGAILSN